MDELARVMVYWKEVWDFAKVRSKEEVVLLVATGEKARDWVCVSVTSNVLGESLGVAKRLRLVVHDAGRRQWLLQRLAGNVDALVRGVAARSSVAEPPVCEFADAVPVFDVQSQTIMRALGIAMGRVGSVAQEQILDSTSQYFVANVGRALWASFAHLRSQADERGIRDFEQLLGDQEGRCL